MVSRYEILSALALVAAIGLCTYLVERAHPDEPPQQVVEAPSETSPRRFTPAAAMRAVFGAYNPERGGVLTPLALTRSWQMSEATEWATPLFVATYREGPAEKGVLAVERRPVVDGKTPDSPSSAAVISVYVFRKDGAHWVFEKGRKQAAEAGAYGRAPEATLLRLGDERYGLLFRGGFVAEGHGERSVFLLGLSEPRIEKLLGFDLGAEAAGQCSDGSGTQRPSCRSMPTALGFLREPGKEYYLIERREIRPGSARVRSELKSVDYYRKGAGLYEKIAAPGSGAWEPVPSSLVYAAGTVLLPQPEDAASP